MQLVHLGLRNFRQHADTRIDFRPGLTGIIGPNGAGKTTILEAIAWSIYGASAARGTNETLRFSRAAPRSRVEVELVFRLGAHEYRVLRSLSGADVFVDGGESPVASGLGGVADYLTRRIGMTREEFFNTYFTGQKELQFLAQMGPTQRARFLGQVLGYERLRVAQDAARARKNALRHEADGLRAGLPDPAAVRAELEQAMSRRKKAGKELKVAGHALEDAQKRLQTVRPAHDEQQQKRDRDRELEQTIRAASAQAEAAATELRRRDAELANIAGAETELATLAADVAQVAVVAEECERFAERAARYERRRALGESEVAARSELAELRENIAKLEQAPELLAKFSVELDALREQRKAAQMEVERLQAEWVQERQDYDTRLRTYWDRDKELKAQIRQLQAAGPEGVCPTCSRPLREQFDEFLARLLDERERLSQDGRYFQQRIQQLEARPAPLVQAEEQHATLQARVDDRTQKVARCERGVQDLEGSRSELVRREQRLEKLTAELAGLPTDYDEAAHRAARARLDALRAVEKRAERLAQAVVARAGVEQARADWAARETAAIQAAAAGRSERERIGFSEEALREIRERFESAAAAVRASELDVTAARGRVEAAEEAVATAERASAALAERLERLRTLDLDHRHHHELDAALGQLAVELNARVRPELSALASTFLTDVTDGRYTSLELDEQYNILVLDEGEEKPVISGGEEDVANLVLRLAISQMIAERAGHPLSVLILDEVFASLDIDRRDSVIQLLHRLNQRFEQVILITHVETVREGLDRVVRVSFDERSGSSVVREEESTEEERELLMV